MQSVNRLLILMFVGIVLASFSVTAANQNVSQENITINLSILDKPAITNLLVEDSDTGGVPGTIDPIPNSTYWVNCSADISDQDGDGDLVSAWAYLWHESVAIGDGDDPQNHFYNDSCAITGVDGDNNAKVDCLFTLSFYTWNGSWTCNLTVNDTGDLNGTAETTATITELMAINVDNSDLDFGSLAINKTTQSVDYDRTIWNEGNINISVKLNTWGGAAQNDGDSMDCTVGSIRDDQLRVSDTAAQDWTLKTPLQSVAGDGVDIVPDFAIARQTAGSAPTSGVLHFGMATDAQGTDGLFNGVCSGNLMFTGILDD
jgi:hypothetical protein